ncbi:MAG: hypothetical protein JSV31_26185 [Desulfobacterales bacterium]|nr:MAG: hypothetical protein JSV31_26185 [Desulfobacterales bacterium]
MIQFRLPQYEMRYSNNGDWVSISERSALESLLDNFDRVSPIIDEMLQGKEILIQNSVYRILKPQPLIISD